MLTANHLTPTVDQPSEQPAVFGATTLPRSQQKPAVTFRFDKGEIGLSTALIRLLSPAVEDTRRVALVHYRRSWYITTVGNDEGFWINYQTKPGYGPTSFVIASKAFTQQALRNMGYGAGDVLVFPIAPHPVAAEDVALRSADYPNPFYRLVDDQKFLKSK